MAELFKENLSLQNIHALVTAISEQGIQYSIQLDQQAFEKTLIEQCNEKGVDDWQHLSLMERLRAAAQALYSVMPQEAGADAVVEAIKQNNQLSGWLSLVCCEYVAIHERLSLALGLDYLKQMTEFFSAEFAIRAFITRQPEETLTILNSWLKDDNHHVRRLISEGTRPRLPWGIRLPLFIEQPNLVIPLLLALRDDEEEYVRRSVANHLNDIAKDHPQLVIEIAQQWLAPDALKKLNNEQEKQRIKLVRHGCRTLFKKGDPKVMALFGYGDVAGLQCQIKLQDDKIVWGSELVFDLLVDGKEMNDNKYMVDYVVHYQKANGKLAAKVFKWLDRKDLVTNNNAFQKKHSFKAISTRKHYPGLHKLEVVINGIKKAEADFELSIKDGLD